MPAAAAETATGLIHAALRRHAAEAPGRPAFTFLRDGGDGGGRSLAYGELVQRAEERAAGLRGLHGERVLLLHPPGEDFVIDFCACLIAGAIAVPLHPPTTRRLLERVQRVCADCQPRLALGCPEAAIPPAPAARPWTGGDEVAFLQYTSGSTGDPKGVMVTHGNLLCGSAIIATGFGTGPDDVAVNWLPLHHDMGLVGSVVHVLLQGLHAVHMTPEAMIRQPLRWLRAMSAHGATVSGGPDFAWRLLADRIATGDLAGLDLARWRVAYTGAEPVRRDTLDRVAALLAPTGFRASAFLPCYGLAEATLMVSGGPPLAGVRCAPAPRDGIPRVACGAPVPAGSVAIVDPATRSALEAGCEGEVWVRGGHVATGYWGRPEPTAAVFAARVAGDPRPWLRTGDLGFLAGGCLHISGRIKDLLIVNGCKHHPEDVEATVQGAVPACAGGASAAFQGGSDAAPLLVVAVELPRLPADAGAREAIAAAVRRAVWSGHGLQADAVVFERLGRLPRTTSGKVRRAACAARHRAGGWDADGLPA